MSVALITGNLGFVGRYLTEHLIAKGFEVAGFDAAGGCDIRNYEMLRLAIEHANPDLIFHLAAPAFVPESTTDPRRCSQVIINGTLNLLEAVRHTGSRARIHIAGTSAEYGYQTGSSITEATLTNPDTPYGSFKLAAGHLALNYAKLYKMPIVVTRAFNHTGPGQPSVYAIPSFARRIAEVEKGKRKTVTHGDLTALRNYTDVRDMVRAYADAIFLDTGIYNVCSDNNVSMQEVLDILIGSSPHEIELESDEGLYRLGYQQGPQEMPVPSCEKFRLITGWKTEIPLLKTLQDTLNYWRGRV